MVAGNGVMSREQVWDVISGYKHRLLINSLVFRDLYCFTYNKFNISS